MNMITGKIRLKKIAKIALAFAIASTVLVLGNANAEQAKVGSKLEKACNADLGDDLQGCSGISSSGMTGTAHKKVVDACVGKASRAYKKCITLRSGDKYPQAQPAIGESTDGTVGGNNQIQ